MNVTRVVSLLMVGFLMLTIGCKMNKWRADEFEGAWQLESVGGVPSQTGATGATFTLNHDGRFTANFLPPAFLRLEDVKTDHGITGSGTWSLTGNNGGREERIRLTFTSVEGSNGRNLPYGAELFIQKSNKSPRLFYFKGDPDENQRIVFQRDPARE